MEYYYDLATNNNSNLLNSFRAIYEDGFPDINEREDYDVILKRVTLQKQSKEPYTVIVLDTLETNNQEKEVTGGLIIDWYERSQTIHLIYLIVSENHRKKGIAKKLINEGISKVIEWVKDEKGIEIKNVVFESNNPYETKTDNFAPSERLLAFSGLGAKWINISYVQPPLDLKKKLVNNLLLLSFTQFNKKKNKIPAVEIKAFLLDLYEGLGITDLEDNIHLEKMYLELDKMEDENGDIELEDLMEDSKYQFGSGKASITYHFIEDQSFTKKNKEKIKTCEHFHSLEKDLLNYQNQSFAPLNSRFVRSVDNITLLLPKAYQYSSEGKIHIRLVLKSEIDVITSLSFTYFNNSDLKIWHLTISPKNDYYFTELDIIKLATQFGSIQECSDVKENICLKYKNRRTKLMTIKELMMELSNSKSSISLNSGIIQLLTNEIEEHVINNFSKQIQDTKRHEIEDKGVMSLAKAVCGIVQGIFDFDRMDEEEIYDTIKPFMSSDLSFLSLSRGTLLKFSKEDEIMEVVKDSIIISPYLLIPSSVLVHNENILATANNLLNQSLENKSSLTLKNLSSNQEKIHRLINYEYVDNIFQYHTENEIINNGNLERGLTFLKSNIQDRLKELEEKISTKRNKIKMFSDAMIVAILFIIAALEFGKEFLSLPIDHNLMFIGLPTLMIIIFSFFSIKKFV
jgi:GNAT superfamily N-acetyltransferase